MLAEGTDVAVADGEKFNLWESGDVAGSKS